MPTGADTFSVDYQQVLVLSQNRSAVLVDVRPGDFFSGKKSDEARAGRIPGAVNRPFTLDVSANTSVFIRGHTAFPLLYRLVATCMAAHCCPRIKGRSCVRFRDPAFSRMALA